MLLHDNNVGWSHMIAKAEMSQSSKDLGRTKITIKTNSTLLLLVGKKKEEWWKEWELNNICIHSFIILMSFLGK